MSDNSRGGWTLKNINKTFINNNSVSIDTEKVINFYDNEYDNLDQNKNKLLEDFRTAANVHRIVRNKARERLISGNKYLDVVRSIEDDIIKYTKVGDRMEYFKNLDKYKSGIAFPIGFSVNDIIAHDTPLNNDDRVIKDNDIIKIDIGVKINDSIIDSAFTHIVNNSNNEYENKYKPLIDSTIDATYTAIALSGIDARLYEISESISEVIKSYEIEDGTNVININPVGGIGGHNVLPSRVHGEKLILCRPHEIQEGIKMDDGDVFAIETYATTGTGEINKIQHSGDLSHFAYNTTRNNNKYKRAFSRLNKTGLEDWIIKRGELPFTNRWCDEIGIKNTHITLNKHLNQYIIGFPPLTEGKNTYTSQLEHTIYISEKGVEVFSLGNDY